MSKGLYKLTHVSVTGVVEKPNSNKVNNEKRKKNVKCKISQLFVFSGDTRL